MFRQYAVLFRVCVLGLVVSAGWALVAGSQVAVGVAVVFLLGALFAPKRPWARKSKAALQDPVKVEYFEEYDALEEGPSEPSPDGEPAPRRSSEPQA